MNFLTVGDIAKELDIDRDAASYAIRKANIQPVGRAGIVRLFSDSTVEIVKNFINSKKRSSEVSQCTA
jgi:hypothetical protein